MIELSYLASWNIALLIILVSISAIYWLLVKKYSVDGPFQPYLFHISVGLFYLVFGSPLYVFSHVSFSTHMVQMSIFYFIVPPLLLLGIPGKLIKKIKWRNPYITSFSALVIFSILFFFYHLPPIHQLLYKSQTIHMGFMFFLFSLSLLMWKPITDSGSGSERKRKRYSWWSGILLMPACLLFIVNGFTNEVNASPLVNQLILELCIPAGQAHSLLPFQINTRIDQILGGLLMLGLHKVSLLMAFRLRNRKTNQENVKFEIIKPSIQRME